MTIEHARDIFQRLLDGDTKGYDIEGYFPEELMEIEIRENLKNEKRDASALDPAGKKSADEMENELTAALAVYQVKRARAMFAAMHAARDAGLVRPEHVLNPIFAELRRARTDLSALDPDGKKSVAEMQQELNDAARPYRIKFAQSLFSGLLQGKASGALAKLKVDEIRTLLKQAEADAAVLNPEGTISAEGMEKMLDKLADSLPPVKPLKKR